MRSLAILGCLLRTVRKSLVIQLDMPIKTVTVPAGVTLTRWIQAEKDMLGKTIKGEHPMKLYFKSFNGEQIRLYTITLPH